MLQSTSIREGVLRKNKGKAFPLLNRQDGSFSDVKKTFERVLHKIKFKLIMMMKIVNMVMIIVKKKLMMMKITTTKNRQGSPTNKRGRDPD